MPGKKTAVNSKNPSRAAVRGPNRSGSVTTNVTSGKLTPYTSLLIKSPPLPIRSKADHAKALRKVESFMTQPHLGKAESQYVELLSTLIEHYESQEHPTPDVSQSQMLAHLMSEKRVSQATVAKQTKIARTTISNVLAGRRELSKQNIAKLSSFFGVSAGAWF